MKHLLLTTIAAVVLVGCGNPEADRALLNAANDGNIKAVKQHLAAGADVNAKSKFGRTPLHLAAVDGRKEIAELLIAQGADVNAKIADGYTPLDTAINYNQSEITALLRKHGGKTKKELEAAGNPTEPVVEAATPETPTAKAPNISISKAVDSGNLEAVKQHIAAGANVNKKGIGGLSLLHWAANYGHKEIAALLIANGANVNVGRTLLDNKMKIYYGETPLDSALSVWEDDSPEVKAAKKKTAKLLRKHGGKTRKELKTAEPVVEAAKPKPPTAKAPDISIHVAASDGNIETVKQHLAAGADVNAKSKTGRTPLHWAARFGRKEVVELLIAKGADVNAKAGNVGWTPLHFAAYSGHKEIAEVLIAKGVDVNAKTGAADALGHAVGTRPLDLAIKRKRTEIADLLRKHGGKTGVELKAEGKPNNPVTEAAQSEPPTAKAIDILIFKAAFEGNVEAVKQRLAAGTDVNAKNNDGSTPLHIAARHGVKEVAELLIDKGADVNVKNAFGRTPLDYSEEVKDWYSPKDKAAKKEIADLLRKQGGKSGKR